MGEEKESLSSAASQDLQQQAPGAFLHPPGSQLAPGALGSTEGAGRRTSPHSHLWTPVKARFSQGSSIPNSHNITGELIQEPSKEP